MTDYLMELNNAQREAVTATEGYVRVIAGAGSGKTRALSYRFAYLVNELGILPGNILCVTFTNKSANEMRQRIHNLTGDSDTGYINTFHGFCVSILQEDSYAVQYPKSFLVLDNSDIDDMLQMVYEERGLTLRDMPFSRARDMIEIQKGIRKPEYYLDLIRMSPEVLHEKYMHAAAADDIIFYGYLYQEKKCFGLDYNDLIFLSLYIFRENADIREKWQKRLEYIMIDEFQDIDPPQYRLMEVLCGYHKNLFIVGDPDQTIYTWRGANVRYLLDFDKLHPGTRTIMMMENYRSTPEILACANSLIDKNRQRMKKELIPLLPAGPKTLCHFASDSTAEAEWIAAELKYLTGCQDHPAAGMAAEIQMPVPAESTSGGDGTLRLRDIAILYRAHYVTRPVEEVLIREKIPYTIYSGVPFFGRMEIKDALCYLRMICLQDDLSFRRIANKPKRNLGRRRMEFLEAWAASHGSTLYQALRETRENEIFRGTKAAEFLSLIEQFSASYEGRPVSEVLSDILDRSGYEAMLRTEGSQERLDNLAELRQSVYEYETTCGEEVTLEHYLNHIALFTNADTADAGDRVKLMTVHAAKGLEFPAVFLCGMNEGIFPSRKIRTEEGMEEERRLAFVAVTRAKGQLFLSEAGGRSFDGSPRYPSRFILDIDSDLLAFTETPRDSLIEDTRRYIALQDRQLRSEDDEKTRLPDGQRVKHVVFGEGTVLSWDAEKNAYSIRFDRFETPRTISAKVRLETI